MSKNKIGYFLLLSFGIISLTGLFISDPISQDITYHDFSDSKTHFGLLNFWNVSSNLPFLLVGIFGLFNLSVFSNVKVQYSIFFFGVSLVSLGSGYYHFNPNNTTLIWDRLPMTIAFMGIFSAVINEFLHFRYQKIVLVLLVTIGLLSILYWLVFDDLRLYALVQFYPMLAIPIIITFFKSETNVSKGYWLLLLFYVGAKFFEYFDVEIYESLGWISGHSLKHIFAAIGILLLILNRINNKSIESISACDRK